MIWQPGITLEESEKRVILEALAFFRWNKNQTANSLGVSAKTIYNKLSKYGIPLTPEEKKIVDEDVVLPVSKKVAK